MTNNQDLESRRASVRALVKLIAGAAEDAIAAWERDLGRVPSLDDTPERIPPSAALQRATRVLDGATYQLAHTLRPTFFTVMDHSMANIESASLRVATEAKIADIVDGKPDGVHLDAIVAQTGLDKDKLGRVLRMLSTKHFFREVSNDTFTNTRLSYALRAADPSSAFVGFMQAELNQKGFSNLWEALTDPAYAHATDERHSVFSWGIKDEMPDAHLFEWYAKHPERRERFNRAMTALRLGLPNEFYPVASLPPNTTWCDIGGGMGGVLIPVAQTNPKLRLTLQDQPEVLAQAGPHIQKECPALFAEDRIALQPIDFIKESPVKAQDIYYMRFIIHDWPDPVAVTILKNIRKAMSPSSRLLIHDYVLNPPTKSPTPSDTTPAPAPLLPNYGAGGARPYVADLNMLVVLSAKERSIEDVTKLANEAGLQFVRFWDCVETGIVELKVAGA
ncbi:S-adenosyl-L-methionine-dependent methyltransferase [Dentipellis sp. KUC8613]|nr:S-adenosyl-L-methionine-dependent methyltransferase [Dentipellis sp. KUC8613]